MKGAKARSESFGGVTKLVSITDADTKKTWVIDDAARTWSEIDLAKTTTVSPKSATPPKITKKGSDTVAGRACDVYDVEDAFSHVEVCAASGLSALTFGSPSRDDEDRSHAHRKEEDPGRGLRNPRWLYEDRFADLG